MRYEYRVRWIREGRRPQTRIYQTPNAALRKAEAVLAADEVKGETSLHDMPDLVEPPVVERREVSEWEAAPLQITEPSRSAVSNLLARLPPRDAADVLDPFWPGLDDPPGHPSAARVSFPASDR